MFSENTILSWIIFLPTIGMITLLFISRAETIKRVSLFFGLLTFVLSLYLAKPFLPLVTGGEVAEGGRESTYGQLYFEQEATWIQTSDESFVVKYHLGIDGLSMPLVILTTLISVLALAASWNFEAWKKKGLKGYFMLLLFLESGMLGVFCSIDFFLFYVFWEVMLLPMYFLIGVWGGPRKEYAAIKFFIYTLAGSVLMLVAMLAFYFYVPTGLRTFNIIELATNPDIQEIFKSATFLTMPFATTMFIFLFIGFAIKVPIVPFHTWLPDAHVEAPTPVSMILAGVLLKLGGYGIFRFCYPILPTAAQELSVLVGTIGVVSIIYGALCAMAQTDFKRLVAYSSISHMGYVILGAASMTEAGFQGAMFQMIAHGISSPMCFFLVGIIYDRAHHREINRFGGLWLSMPVYGSMATLGFFASLGLPALCGFIGEVYTIFGAFSSGEAALGDWAMPFAIIAASGVVLTAGYILWMIQRVYLGKERPEYAGFSDVSAREIAILVPMAILVLALGILPKQTVLDFITGSLNNILALSGGG